jgi:hypothetical protein
MIEFRSDCCELVVYNIVERYAEVEERMISSSEVVEVAQRRFMVRAGIGIGIDC